MSAGADGFAELLAALDRAADQAVVTNEVRKIVEVGAYHIKADWRKRWTGLKALPHLPRSITYDIDVQGAVVTAEIGPVSGMLQAAIAVVVEYGTIRTAPHPGRRPAAEAEAPKFEKALGDLGERLMDR